MDILPQSSEIGIMADTTIAGTLPVLVTMAFSGDGPDEGTAAPTGLRVSRAEPVLLDGSTAPAGGE